METQIGHWHEEIFPARAYECGVGNRVTLATLCNFMQEAAGIDANNLGWGIRHLQEEGKTWMLSRLHVRVSRYVAWGGSVKVRTWPSGRKGRLVALRCFRAEDASGAAVFEARSEWLYVDMRAMKIAVLPPEFDSLVAEGVPQVEFPDIGGKFAALDGVDGAARVLVRASDLDFNDHVNNVHYVEWALEPLGADAAPAEMDIVFRSAAKAGDELVSEFRRDGDATRHLIRRAAGGDALASAAFVWA